MCKKIHPKLAKKKLCLKFKYLCKIKDFTSANFNYLTFIFKRVYKFAQEHPFEYRRV